MRGAARLRTLAALGVANLARVGLYRIGLRSGLHPVLRATSEVAAGPFFRVPHPRDDLPPANPNWRNKLRWYDWIETDHDGNPPDWFATPFSSGKSVADRSPWWQIPDFGGDDIKDVWELSRFSWLIAMATEAAAGDPVAPDRINLWLASWARENPPYRGPNWKCGQEASIRVIHLLLTAAVLDQDHASLPALVELVQTHLRRIAPTLSYAIGQQNNHGTSEAAAMFVGGDFLSRHGIAAGAIWSRQGRHLLENRAIALIERDGSFSQYSVNYHRLMLDTFCFAEAWRQRHGLAPFSNKVLARLLAATDWLDAMVERQSGDAPNLGANDGARLLPLTATDYRDFRPSLQLASALFRASRAFEPAGPYDAPLRWLGIVAPAKVAPLPVSKTFDDGGYHVLRTASALAVLRYPRFGFRPSQADALHLDVWYEGRNVLRDGGSFSYNDPAGVGTFLAGTAAHNTVEFDGRDQMPRLGRFLFGDWLKTLTMEPVHSDGGRLAAAAGYRDRQGATHHRQVVLDQNSVTSIDRVGGRFGVAVLRWRLPQGDYQVDGERLKGNGLDLTVSATGQTLDLTLTQGPESRYYRQQSQIPILEVRIGQPAEVTTTVRFEPRPRAGGMIN